MFPGSMIDEQTSLVRIPGRSLGPATGRRMSEASYLHFRRGIGAGAQMDRGLLPRNRPDGRRRLGLDEGWGETIPYCLLSGADLLHQAVIWDNPYASARTVIRGASFHSYRCLS